MLAVSSFLVVRIQLKYQKPAALRSSHNSTKLHFMTIFAFSDTRNRFLVEGTHGFYSTSFLCHITGYFVFEFRQINFEFCQNLSKYTYELFSHSVV